MNPNGPYAPNSNGHEHPSQPHQQPLQPPFAYPPFTHPPPPYSSSGPYPPFNPYNPHAQPMSGYPVPAYNPYQHAAQQWGTALPPASYYPPSVPAVPSAPPGPYSTGVSPGSPWTPLPTAAPRMSHQPSAPCVDPSNPSFSNDVPGASTSSDVSMIDPPAQVNSSSAAVLPRDCPQISASELLERARKKAQRHRQGWNGIMFDIENMYTEACRERYIREFNALGKRSVAIIISTLKMDKQKWNTLFQRLCMIIGPCTQDNIREQIEGTSDIDNVKRVFSEWVDDYLLCDPGECVRHCIMNNLDVETLYSSTISNAEHAGRGDHVQFSCPEFTIGNPLFFDEQLVEDIRRNRAEIRKLCITTENHELREVLRPQVNAITGEIEFRPQINKAEHCEGKLRIDNHVVFILKGKRLGKGASGQVRAAFDEHDNDVRALKQIIMDGDRIEKTAEIEANLNLFFYKHDAPNILYTNLIKRSDTYMYFVYPIGYGGALCKLIDNPYVPNGIPESSLQKIVLQVATALKFCHTFGIAHRDVKPDNLLMMNANWNCPEIRLADFGLARVKTWEKSINLLISGGTWGYIAPEIFRNDQSSLSVDIFAFGITLLELATGQSGLVRKHGETAESANRRMSFRWDGMEGLSSELEHLITGCTMEDQNERLTAEDILKHPFLQMKIPESDEEKFIELINQHEKVLKVKQKMRNREKRVQQDVQEPASGSLPPGGQSSGTSDKSISGLRSSSGSLPRHFGGMELRSVSDVLMKPKSGGSLMGGRADSRPGSTLNNRGKRKRSLAEVDGDSVTPAPKRIKKRKQKKVRTKPYVARDCNPWVAQQINAWWAGEIQYMECPQCSDTHFTTETSVQNHDKLYHR